MMPILSANLAVFSLVNSGIGFVSLDCTRTPWSSNGTSLPARFARHTGRERGVATPINFPETSAVVLMRDSRMSLGKGIQTKATQADPRGNGIAGAPHVPLLALSPI